MGLFVGVPGILEVILIAISAGLMVAYAGGAIIGAVAIAHGDVVVGRLCMLMCLLLLATTWDVVMERFR